MVLVRDVGQGIQWVGTIDWDRRLFDALIPLPDGTSYNSYLVKGSEKTALIDGVDNSMVDVLLENLESLGVKKLDYIVSQHAEQDHSGAVSKLAKIYPEAQILASARCMDLLVAFSLVPPDRVRDVKNGEKISLGDKTLEFIHAPWVHWPDTILTYVPESKVLFTCDFLGSHLATSDLYANDETRVYKSAKKYYAEIMMPFRVQIQKHLARVNQINPEVIAPSHGPLYRNPKFILDAYADWSSDKVKNQVVLPFVSMHGATKVMVDYFTDALLSRGVFVQPYDLTKSDMGKIAESLVDAATVVIGSPTVLSGAHPEAIYAAFLANALRPKTKFASIIGSYGWGGKMPEQISQTISNLKVEVLQPVIAKGYPKEEDLKALDRLAEDIASRHKGMGLL
jgi:flavorubredoxin